jgi:ribonuclease HI
MSDDTLQINIDGAARGNPGPAAFAFVIRQAGRLLVEEAGSLGRQTNNVAEYTALVRALEHAAQLGAKRLLILSDSELLVKQMNGAYRVKNADLKVLHDEAQQLRRNFDAVTIRHVMREQNPDADRLCNEVLDGVRPSGPRTAPTRADPTREAALECLRTALTAWRDGRSDAPSAEAVWEQLGAILRARGGKHS